MHKNELLMFNEIIYRLYTCKRKEDLAVEFLEPLRMLIPHSYASIFFANPNAEHMEPNDADLLIPDPVCYPASFRDAELRYIDHVAEDRTVWIIKSKEPVLVRESDLFSDVDRLNAPLYKHCYSKYNVFDILQVSIVYQQKFLGVLSLFRTRVDGYFSDENMFCLRSLGIHLNVVTHRLHGNQSEIETDPAEKLRKAASCYGFTTKECEILRLLLQFYSNEEIADELGIKVNTIQKHLQNIFRKTDVTSKWELLRTLNTIHH